MRKLVLLIFFSLTAAIAIAIGLFGFFIVLSGVSFYRIDAYKPTLSSVITDRNGNVLRYIYGDEHRIWVESEEIPQYLKDATVAMEDRRFFEHSGVDMISVVRAAKSNLDENEIQGGSTITQQYVKNSVLTSERTYTRKFHEMYLSLFLEKVKSKDEILEGYLNEVSYGGIYHGVEAASRYYFGKSTKDISISEAAILASLTKAPTRFTNPENRQELRQRQQIVLEKMVEYGYLTPEELAVASKEEVELQSNTPPFLAPHFTQLVLDELAEKYDQEELATKGLNIKTSLDLELQERVQQIVTSNIDEYVGYKVSNGAALVLQPETGEILAWVGSKNFLSTDIDGQYDVLLARRQPGSTLKPFLYSLALEEGYSAGTIINDSQTVFDTIEGPYSPVNYDSKYHGAVSIRQSLANSYNVPATRMVAVLEVSSFVNFLEKLSIDSINQDQVGISLALGGYEMRPIDLAVAYGVLANQGELVEPTSILEITEPDEQAEVVASPRPERVVDSGVAYIISDILADNPARASAFGSNSLLHVPGEQIAVKTGTSNEKRDNWAIGYTPEYVTLAWVGNNDNSPMTTAASGLTGATPIWRQIQEALMERGDLHWDERPSSVVTAEYDGATGGKFCGSGQQKTELFVEGSVPKDCIQLASVGTSVLYEERNGQKVEIRELDEVDTQQFKDDPFKIIEKYKDVLEADDRPTKIFIEEESQIQDPLTKLAQKQSL